MALVRLDCKRPAHRIGIHTLVIRTSSLEKRFDVPDTNVLVDNG